MRSLLWTALFRLFARISGRELPSASARSDQIADIASSPSSSPQSSAAPAQSPSKPFITVRVAHVSNPYARVVTTAADLLHCVHDASDPCSPPQSRDTKFDSTNQTTAGARYGRYKPDETQQCIEAKTIALLRGFCYRQAVVIGDVPTPLPRGKLFVISPRVDVPPQCVHVCCEPSPEEWPVALALSGFDWRESTVWLLRMQRTSESSTLQQLKAVEMMSAPCSVVVLLSPLDSVSQVVAAAGFRVHDIQNEKPLFLLRRKKHHARCVEAHTPNITPQYTPPREPEKQWSLVRFELSVSSLPKAVHVELDAGCAKVVGNRREVGEWNVDHGIRLVNAEDVLVAEVLVGRGETEYKYVCVDRGGKILWEDGDNRHLAYADQILIRSENHWRAY